MMQNATEADTVAAAAGEASDSALAVAVSHLPDTRSVEFGLTSGDAYDRLEVDRFMSQISQALDEVRAATTSTGQELAALRAENARLRSGAGADFEDEVTAGAMGLLTQAQLIADKAIADAEAYARDLVLTARNQYREILERAETSASQVSATVGAQQQHLPSVPEIEYVRTYARVAQVQLRSVLESLTEQVDRLGQLPQDPQAHHAGPAGDEGATGEPDWAPLTGSIPTQRG